MTILAYTAIAGAIGSGGLLGLGFGKGRQKYLYLPEEHNDYIFPILCEELGFVGAVVVILLFILLIAALALSLFIALLFGALTSSILGTMLFLVLALGSYFGVLYMQSIWTVKDLQKVLASMQLHSWVRVLPCRFKDLWNSTTASTSVY